MPRIVIVEITCKYHLGGRLKDTPVYAQATGDGKIRVWEYGLTGTPAILERKQVHVVPGPMEMRSKARWLNEQQADGGDTCILET